MKLAPLLALCFFLSPAYAAKPDWADGKPPKGEKHRHEHRDEGQRRGEGGIDFRFTEEHRHMLRDYYGAQIRAGHCPPGLAKKKNGCLPPGQAKKWRIGEPLPSGIVVYDLPREVLVRLPPPPPRHRYVRVAGDILLIAIGTSMVVDALEDIMR
ncbi:MAG: RcnB family protein [Rhodocyclaceae bacterium]|nr:RcnB family protein [Rhodocyclaceae bacterium]